MRTTGAASQQRLESNQGMNVKRADDSLRQETRAGNITRHVREQQVRVVYGFPIRLIGHVINSALVAGVVWDRVPHILLGSWLALNILVSLGRYLLTLAFHKRATDSDIEKWAVYFTVGSSVSAALWGVSTFIVWMTPDIANHVFIAFVIAGTISAATAMTYPMLPALYLFLALAGLPLTVNLISVGEGIYIAMGLMSLLLLALLAGQGRAAHGMLLRLFQLQEENRLLVADLSAVRDNLEDRVRERTVELDAANSSLRAEMAARLETEIRLSQAQKMEAIGQLTGGIAHDFNNLLAVIHGNTELLAEKSGDTPMPRELQAILRASARGAQLTQRLLAFSRKQALQPQAVDVNDLVSSMMDMFTRILSDDVRMVFDPGENLPPAEVDPSQLENAILNLAINARDAMMPGGILTITSRIAYLSGEEEGLVTDEVADVVRPGRYVVVEIRDTGKGISKEQLTKVWEPFFTTKRAGEGTGLGLSMVYGFVRQSGGQVQITSVEGEGTTVRLYLPAASAGTAALQVDRADLTTIPKGSEYVFVIDDDREILTLVDKYLTRLGYRVITADSAEQCFERLAEHGKPDIFLSDVLLPGGNRGPAIIAGAQRRFGPVRVVFMSGHVSDTFANGQGPGENVTLIKKPFELAELARTIRRVLDSQPT